MGFLGRKLIEVKVPKTNMANSQTVIYIVIVVVSRFVLVCTGAFACWRAAKNKDKLYGQTIHIG